ncbi:MAG: hypothetical protein IK077_05885, partial [Thermoguttaceae bacterium]|nr:hypothetical protein [Thermoguttaceae bacterium]
CDYDGNGVADLLVGASDGNVYLYRGVKSASLNADGEPGGEFFCSVDWSYEGRTLIVTTTDDVVNNDDYLSLREAIAKARNKDTITFAEPGLIVLVEGQLTISKSITIDASTVWDAQNNAPGVVVSGNNQSRVLYVDGENVELIGIKVVDGSAQDGYGGGVYNKGTLSVRNVDFKSNVSRLGGAIYNKGTLTVTGSDSRACLFMDNEAIGTVVDGAYKYGSGGGLYNSSGSASLANVSFLNNAAYKYGGAVSNFAELQAESIVCLSNIAGAGGALQNAGVAVVASFEAKQNQALVRDQALVGFDFGGNGGAIFQSNKSMSEIISTLNLVGSTFENNHAQNAGGAADFLSGSVVFEGFNGFCANVADVVGGALVVVGDIEFDGATFAFEKENESNTNYAPFGSTVAATSDADSLKESFFGTVDLSALTNGEPYNLFDTFIRARTITDELDTLALNFDFFAGTTAESVTSVTVLRVDNGESITVVKGIPTEGQVNSVTLGELGVTESAWNSGDSIDVHYYVNGNADYKFKLTLTRAINGSMMVQRIDMDGHAAAGSVGFIFRTFGYEPVSSWVIDWDEKDEDGIAFKSEYTGLGYLWNAYHIYKDEGVKHSLTLTVKYANETTDVFTLTCVSPKKETDSGAVLDEENWFGEFFADKDWIEDLFDL